MKNLFIAAVALLTMVSCTQSKVGYADTIKIQDEYKAIKDLKQELENETKQLQAKYEKLEANFQTQVQAYQKKGRPNQKKEQELQAIYQQIGAGYQAEVNALDKENKERLKAMVEDIKLFTEDFAKKKGYTYIMGVDEESLDLIYADKKYNVTNDLIDALNEDYKSEKKTERVKADSQDEAVATTSKDADELTGTIDGKEGTVELSKDELLKAELDVKGVDNASYEVSSCMVKVPGQLTVYSEGNKLSDEAKRAIEKAEIGQVVTIFKINVVGNESKKVAPVNVLIK